MARHRKAGPTTCPKTEGGAGRHTGLYPTYAAQSSTASSAGSAGMPVARISRTALGVMSAAERSQRVIWSVLKHASSAASSTGRPLRFLPARNSDPSGVRPFSTSTGPRASKRWGQRVGRTLIESGNSQAATPPILRCKIGYKFGTMLSSGQQAGGGFRRSWRARNAWKTQKNTKARQFAHPRT